MELHGLSVDVVLSLLPAGVLSRLVDAEPISPESACTDEFPSAPGAEICCRNEARGSRRRLDGGGDRAEPLQQLLSCWLAATGKRRRRRFAMAGPTPRSSPWPAGCGVSNVCAVDGAGEGDRSSSAPSRPAVALSCACLPRFASMRGDDDDDPAANIIPSDEVGEPVRVSEASGAPSHT